jgi:AsmA-like C-terminal region/Glycine zipper
MTRTRKWLAGLGILAAVVVLLGLIGLSLIPKDEELARRAAAKLTEVSGVPVSVGALQWRVLPAPRVVLQNVLTEQSRPIELKLLTLYFELGPLLQRRIKVDRVLLDGATVPQLSLRALGKTGGADQTPGTLPFAVDDLPLARFEFREVTWLTRRGLALVYEGEVEFDAKWRPRAGQLRRPGLNPAADLTITREGQEDRWATRINLADGTANGEVRLQTRADGRLHLDGTLRPEGIDAANAVIAFNRRAVLAGKASGVTTLSADGDTVGELVQSLHTQSTLRISRARLLRFDLEKAVRSAGREHAGQTPLDSLTAQMDTQNTAQGIVLDFSNVKASSGALTATGKGRLANQTIEAEVAVDLVSGLVGVPLTISGPVSAVKVSVPAGAIAGAAVGTAVLPGIGTAIGARIGATLGNIFGTRPQPSSGKKPPASAPVTR